MAKTLLEGWREKLSTLEAPEDMPELVKMDVGDLSEALVKRYDKSGELLDSALIRPKKDAAEFPGDSGTNGGLFVSGQRTLEDPRQLLRFGFAYDPRGLCTYFRIRVENAAGNNRADVSFAGTDNVIGQVSNGGNSQRISRYSPEGYRKSSSIYILGNIPKKEDHTLALIRQIAEEGIVTEARVLLTLRVKGLTPAQLVGFIEKRVAEMIRSSEAK